MAALISSATFRYSEDPVMHTKSTWPNVILAARPAFRGYRQLEVKPAFPRGRRSPMTGDGNGNRYTVADIDITRPNVARVYDCFLDGKDNFAADREFVRQALEIVPDPAS